MREAIFFFCSIAQFEWHPFTISSAPEQAKNTLNVHRVTMTCLMKAKTLSLHIRAVGHWTNSLYQYFEKEQAKLEGTSVPVDKKSRLVLLLNLFPCISLPLPGCEKQSAWRRTGHGR